MAVNAIGGVELGKRLWHCIERASVSPSAIAKSISMPERDLIRKLLGSDKFSSMELALICEKISVRVDALFQPTWDEFIARLTGTYSELDELKKLLTDLGYQIPSDDPEILLDTATGVYMSGRIGVRVLIRFVRVLGPIILGEESL